MSFLHSKVSFYPHFSATDKPKEGPFLAVVNSPKLAKEFGPIIETIRATEDKKERDRLKKSLPCFQPSGIFSRRAADGLKEHSHLLMFDIDPGQNPGLNEQTAPLWRDRIAGLQEVAYCALSVSGKGVWGVVPISNPEHHKEHFAALEADFAGWGITIDAACKNVAHLRFWSHDPAAYINESAAVYTKLIFPQPTYTQSTTAQRWGESRPDDLTKQAAEYLIKNRVSLECTYDSFMRIAFACKYEWGEPGKDIALDILHACTTFAASNTARNFDTLWKNIRRGSGKVTTGGTLVHLAKESGFKYHQSAPQETYQAPPIYTITKRPTAPPAPSALPPGYHRETYTVKATGAKIERLINADGYPAEWDIKPPQSETLARMIKAAPAITDLISCFDLKPDRESWQMSWEQSEKAWQEKRDRTKRWFPAAYGLPTPQPYKPIKKR
jgi:hypothetical protein